MPIRQDSAEAQQGVQARASLDELLRVIDAQIAAIDLSDLPKPAGRNNESVATAALRAEVEQLCEQRVVSIREQHRWFLEAERAIRENDDARAMDALTRHAEHLRLAQQAEAQLNEFRSLIADALRSLSSER